VPFKQPAKPDVNPNPYSGYKDERKNEPRYDGPLMDDDA